MHCGVAYESIRSFTRDHLIRVWSNVEYYLPPEGSMMDNLVWLTKHDIIKIYKRLSRTSQVY